VNLPKTGSMLRRLLIIAPLVLVLTLVSLFLPARQVTIKGIGTLSIGQEAAYASPDWLSGWAYRKSHIINSATGAGTNYQVKVKVYYGSGTDSGENVYLGSKCRTDFGDVRFADDNQTTLLDYWLQEKVDSNYAIFWVEVADDLGTANRTIYIYYGKSDATTTSNGANTFVFFDDFNDNSIDTTKWQTFNGSWSETTGIMRQTSTATQDPKKCIAKSAPTGNNYAFRAKVRVDSGTNTDERAGVSIKNNTTDGRAYNYVFHNHSTKNTAQFLNDLVAWGNPYSYSWAQGTWYWFEITTYGGTNVYGRCWAVTATEPSFNSQGWSGRTGYPALNGGSFGGTHSFDDAFVRKYVSPEPSHGTWGSEERFPLDISNAPLAGKDFGTVSKNSSYWSKGSAPNWTDGLDDGECYFTVTNNSPNPINISIRATNFTSSGVGWTLASSPGVNIVVLKAGKSGDLTEGAMVILTIADKSFITGLGASQSKKWELKLETGTFTDAAQKTSTITLTATYP